MAAVPTLSNKIKRYVAPWNPNVFVELEITLDDEIMHRKIVNHNLDFFGMHINPRVHKLLETGYVKQRSKKWQTSRKEKITASKVAAIIGHNEKCTREEAFNVEVGRTPPFKGNQYTAHGITYEPVAIRRYMEVMKKIGLKFGLIPHPDYDYVGGSPDLITLDGIVVEVKCPYSRKQERIDAVSNGEVPRMYMPQIQLVMEITKLDLAHYVEYYPATVKYAPSKRTPAMHIKEEIFVVEVHRDPEWFQHHFPIIKNFHNDLVQFSRVKREYAAKIIQHRYRYHKKQKLSSLLMLLHLRVKFRQHMGKPPKRKPTEQDKRMASFMNVDL